MNLTQYKDHMTKHANGTLFEIPCPYGCECTMTERDLVNKHLVMFGTSSINKELMDMCKK